MENFRSAGYANQRSRNGLLRPIGLNPLSPYSTANNMILWHFDERTGTFFNSRLVFLDQLIIRPNQEWETVQTLLQLRHSGVVNLIESIEMAGELPTANPSTKAVSSAI